VAAVGSNVRPGQKLAVVVGAGGMAMGAARRLGARYRLLLADRDATHLDRQVAALRIEGFDIEGICCDVTDPGAIAALAGRVAESGPLRAIAHVVGLSPSMGDWRALLAVNLVGARRIAEALLPLATQGTAAIFIASLAGHIAPPAPEVIAVLDDPLAPDFLSRLEAVVTAEHTSTLAYQLSKFALIRMCQQLAWRWGEKGARIVSLSPGLIATPMGALEFERQPMKYTLLEQTPLQREGTTIEIADAIAFLASDRASFISGTDLLVDGGIAAALKHGI
jgi:NAD(P)-dependent dehydrogenase (short-subunit alcohol dehydrogenase family)